MVKRGSACRSPNLNCAWGIFAPRDIQHFGRLVDAVHNMPAL
jgi:hypothetical protein